MRVPPWPPRRRSSPACPGDSRSGRCTCPGSREREREAHALVEVPRVEGAVVRGHGVRPVVGVPPGHGVAHLDRQRRRREGGVGDLDGVLGGAAGGGTARVRTDAKAPTRESARERRRTAGMGTPLRCGCSRYRAARIPKGFSRRPGRARPPAEPPRRQNLRTAYSLGRRAMTARPAPPSRSSPVARNALVRNSAGTATSGTGPPPRRGVSGRRRGHHDDPPGHVRMGRAQVGVRARRREREAERGALRQVPGVELAGGACRGVNGLVLVRPRHRVAGGDRQHRRGEGEVGDLTACVAARAISIDPSTNRISAASSSASAPRRAVDAGIGRVTSLGKGCG